MIADVCWELEFVAKSLWTAIVVAWMVVTVLVDEKNPNQAMICKQLSVSNNESIETASH
jgi:hypothetical protein